MSKYRKAFLAWWVTMMVLVTVLASIGSHTYWDEMQLTVPQFLPGLAMMACVFGAWRNIFGEVLP
jgi:hypothetical protein